MGLSLSQSCTCRNMLSPEQGHCESFCGRLKQMLLLILWDNEVQQLQSPSVLRASGLNMGRFKRSLALSFFVMPDPISTYFP